MVSGLAAGMDLLAASESPQAFSGFDIAVFMVAGAAMGASAMVLLRWGTAWWVRRMELDEGSKRKFLRYEVVSYLPGLVTILGAWGVQMIPPVAVSAALAVVLIKGVVLYAVLPREQKARAFSSLGYVAVLFLISGFAALIYQIVWQRTLFAAFGVNIESITIIVSLFMFGLGVGSLVGGILASRFPGRAPVLFLSCELGIGLFGLVSLPLIQWVSTLTLHGSLIEVSLAIYALLCIPTIFMGATLPILVNHLYRHYRNVGKSVGLLYCINTIGSALACFITADLLFAVLGQQGAVYVAAGCNLTVGILVSRYTGRITGQSAGSERRAEDAIIK